MTVPSLMASPDAHSHLCFVEKNVLPYNILHMVHMDTRRGNKGSGAGGGAGYVMENEENEDRYVGMVLGCDDILVQDTSKVYDELYYQHEKNCT